MALSEIDLTDLARSVSLGQNTLFEKPPAPVLSFLADAEQHIECFFSSRALDKPRISAYASSNYHVAYNTLRTLQALYKNNGQPDAKTLAFCEWGSGFGIVTCLAAMLGLQACGIEIEPELVTQARQLAASHGINAIFSLGSYALPASSYVFPADFKPDKLLDFRLVEFDLIYAYPWPAEEKRILALFERHARSGALLVTYHGGGRIRGWKAGQVESENSVLVPRVNNIE